MARLLLALRDGEVQGIQGVGGQGFGGGGGTIVVDENCSVSAAIPTVVHTDLTTIDHVKHSAGVWGTGDPQSLMAERYATIGRKRSDLDWLLKRQSVASA